MSFLNPDSHFSLSEIWFTLHYLESYSHFSLSGIWFTLFIIWNLDSGTTLSGSKSGFQWNFYQIIIKYIVLVACKENEEIIWFNCLIADLGWWWYFLYCWSGWYIYIWCWLKLLIWLIHIYLMLVDIVDLVDTYISDVGWSCWYIFIWCWLRLLIWLIHKYLILVDVVDLV